MFFTEAALKFKRAQATEVGANRLAARSVDAQTAQQIAFNGETGTRLAQIATAADLREAKGEISPEGKINTAKKRMSGNLAKLSNFFVTLDSTGAILNVDNTTFDRAVACNLKVEEFFANNDSYHFFKELDDLLLTGPTNTNVMDLRIILIP